MSGLKSCPTCQREFEQNYLRCPFDGEALLEPGHTEDPMLGRRLAETYQLVGCLGSGGMGSVYKALHIRLETEFAIKVLRPELTIHAEVLKRFHREARSACQLKQPNIINVFDVNKTEDGIHYIVQELLEGESLGALLHRERVLPLAHGVGLLGQICDAMAAAHAKEIIHRDLKPENVFICRQDGKRDFVKVLDFGIAKMQEPGTQLTLASEVFGTPFFMAPEQAAAAGSADALSDIYSVGVIAYRMFTGDLPYEGKDARVVMALVQVEDPVPPRQRRADLPPGVEAVIMRAMARQPAARFGSMLELKQALQGLLPTTEEVPEKGPAEDAGFAATLPSDPHLVLPGPEQATAPDVPPTQVGIGPTAPDQQEVQPAPPSQETTPPSLIKGQVPPTLQDPPRRSKAVYVIVGLVLVLGAAGLLVYRALGPDDPQAPAPGVAAKPPDGQQLARPGPPKEARADQGEPAGPDSAAAIQGMLLVKGGRFTMGYDRGSKDERPAHPCQVDDFLIDLDEVTRGEFAVFLASPAGRELRSKRQWKSYKVAPAARALPVTNVTWAEADSYCRSRPTGQLPSEAQWEYAARGPRHRWLYPGGAKPPGAAFANYTRPGKPAALRRASAPLHGLRDMCGNAAEWVRDSLTVYTARGCAHRKRPTSRGMDRFKVIRGGGFDDHDPARLRATYRIYQDPRTFRWKSLGFRCVQQVRRP